MSNTDDHHQPPHPPYTKRLFMALLVTAVLTADVHVEADYGSGYASGTDDAGTRQFWDSQFWDSQGAYSQGALRGSGSGAASRIVDDDYGYGYVERDDDRHDDDDYDPIYYGYNNNHDYDDDDDDDTGGGENTDDTTTTTTTTTNDDDDESKKKEAAIAAKCLPPPNPCRAIDNEFACKDTTFKNYGDDDYNDEGDYEDERCLWHKDEVTAKGYCINPFQAYDVSYERNLANAILDAAPKAGGDSSLCSLLFTEDGCNAAVRDYTPAHLARFDYPKCMYLEGQCLDYDPICCSKLHSGDGRACFDAPPPGQCFNGGLALTPDLYNQGYEKYKDAECIPDYSFCVVSQRRITECENNEDCRLGKLNYTCPDSPGQSVVGNFTTMKLDKLIYVGTGAFWGFEARIDIDWNGMPLFQRIEQHAFFEAGTDDSTIQLANLKGLEYFGVSAFKGCHGTIKVDGSGMTSLKAIQRWAFHFAGCKPGSTGSSVQFDDPTALVLVGLQAFSRFCGDVRFDGTFSSLKKIGMSAFANLGRAGRDMDNPKVPVGQDTPDGVPRSFRGSLQFTGTFPKLLVIGSYAFGSMGVAYIESWMPGRDESYDIGCDIARYSTGYATCGDVDKCVRESYHCDGYNDCGNNFDEIGCGGLGNGRKIGGGDPNFKYSTSDNAYKKSFPFDATVRIDGASSLRVIGSYAFAHYSGLVQFSGNFQDLVVIGEGAYFHTGSPEHAHCNSVVFDGATSLVRIEADSFRDFSGDVSFIGQFPNLIYLGSRAFLRSGTANSTIDIQCRGPSYKLDYQAESSVGKPWNIYRNGPFAFFKGDHASLLSGEDCSCSYLTVDGECTNITAVITTRRPDTTTTSGITSEAATTTTEEPLTTATTQDYIHNLCGKEPVDSTTTTSSTTTAEPGGFTTTTSTTTTAEPAGFTTTTSSTTTAEPVAVTTTTSTPEWVTTTTSTDVFTTSFTSTAEPWGAHNTTETPSTRSAAGGGKVAVDFTTETSTTAEHEIEESTAMQKVAPLVLVILIPLLILIIMSCCAIIVCIRRRRKRQMEDAADQPSHVVVNAAYDSGATTIAVVDALHAHAAPQYIQRTPHTEGAYAEVAGVQHVDPEYDEVARITVNPSYDNVAGTNIEGAYAEMPDETRGAIGNETYAGVQARGGAISNDTYADTKMEDAYANMPAGENRDAIANASYDQVGADPTYDEMALVTVNEGDQEEYEC